MAQQVHVPRVWEVTGKAPEDRRRAVREWRETYKRLRESPSYNSAKRLRQDTRSV